METRIGPSDSRFAPERVLVVIPNWVGDVVMATPALSALRRRFADARIVHLMRPYVADVLAGTGFCDEQVFWPSGGGFWGWVGQLRRRRFDLAVLLTNSFRSAMIARLTGARRRVGYARDSRGFLLTDRLKPAKKDGAFVPVPALDYYNDLARHLGCDDVSDRMILAVSPEDEAVVDRRLASDARPLVVLNPGASFGVAKCWPAEKYAAVADMLTLRHGARVVASLGPNEGEIAGRLEAAAREPIEVFHDPPLGLGPLRALIKRCDLLITNDTGPRHFAPAFNVPVVTVYGSSDPAWTVTRFSKERSVHLDLDCQPCMSRVCPHGHHDCMRTLEPELVFDAAVALLPSRGDVPVKGQVGC